jgi:FAD/FMN-containing dehydrogenase
MSGAAFSGIDALVVTDPLDLLTYQRDTSVVSPGRATTLVRPRTREAVADLLREATSSRTPVYVRGAGSMYAGGVNPQAGGIVLDLSALDRILEIDVARGIVVAEAGVRFGALAEALTPLGLTVGIVPSTAPTATLGGAASSHALGTGSPRFQSFADEVVGVEVALADGTVLRTGSAAAGACGFFHRQAMGPDITGLFLGADATLGVITVLALWLHPLPAVRRTCCYGFPTVESAGDFLARLQAQELTRNIWYAGGYERGAIQSRVLAAQPATDPASLPAFCVGIDFGGEETLLRYDEACIADLATELGGTPFPLFDEIYFRHLRNEQIYWYGYAGYFARSRCVILMTSLATPDLPRFITTLNSLRAEEKELAWGGAVVVCRRGLHGGVLGFYDEQSQWPEAQAAARRAARRLLDAGCVPYKTGKLWADEVRGFTTHHDLLERVKRALDPAGVLAPGNLGLDSRLDTAAPAA